MHHQLFITLQSFSDDPLREHGTVAFLCNIKEIKAYAGNDMSVICTCITGYKRVNSVRLTTLLAEPDRVSDYERSDVFPDPKAFCYHWGRLVEATCVPKRGGLGRKYQHD